LYIFRFLTTPSTSVAVKPGGIALLECPGIGNPVPKAVWSRPDASIHNNRTSDLGYGLQILDVKHHDQGTYVCQLDNGIAPALVHQVRLIVLDAPEIIEPPRASLTNEYEELELHCVAKGSPSPEVYWMINGFDTRWDPLIQNNGSKLVIKSVEKKHAGIVQCFARNTVGEVSGSNLLQVNPKQISGSAMQPLGSVPQSTKANNEHGKTRQRKKHKHRKFQHLLLFFLRVVRR
jgi:brother of ihog